MKKRVWTDSKGRVVVTSFPPKSQRDKWRPKDETDEEFISHAWDKRVARNPEASAYIEVNELPEREDVDGSPRRGQWAIENGKVKIDKNKPCKHRDIFFKVKEIEDLEAKPNLTDADLIELRRKDAELRALKKK